MPGLVEIYQKTKKTPDFFWNRFVCRPIATVVVAAAADTRVTPNQITVVALVLALGAATAVVVAPGYFGLLGAIVLFQLSYVLDCADGMLARWRRTASTAGHLFDFLMDEIKAFAMLGAVGVRLWRDTGNVVFLLVGVGGLIALATGVSITTFLRRPEIVGERETVETPSAHLQAGLRPSGPLLASLASSESNSCSRSQSLPPPSLVLRTIRVAEGVAKFFIHYPSYILYAAIAGRIDVFFFIYVGVNTLYAVRALGTVAVRFGRG